MNRLCERPGCSQPAEVAYGFDADHLTVWLDAMGEVQGMRFGVLCRRHADAMIVPLGWMLDDRREPTLRLFKTAAVDTAPTRPRRERRMRGRDDTNEQLRLAVPPEDPEPASSVEVVAVLEVMEVVEVEVDEETEVLAAETPWVPVFDSSDDLHGLLKARGRLLSRAFNGAPTDPS